MFVLNNGVEVADPFLIIFANDSVAAMAEMSSSTVTMFHFHCLIDRSSIINAGSNEIICVCASAHTQYSIRAYILYANWIFAYTVSDHMFFKKMEIQIAFLCENHGSTGGKKSPDFELSPSILRFKTKVYDFRIQRDFLGRDHSVNIFRCRSSTIYSRPK